MPPDHALVASVFGDRVDLIHQYVDLLASEAVARGLIGPREVSRLWTRHIFNCAAVAPLIGAGRTVCDVGSGAGLPGMVLAIARPDLTVTLIEPLLRRTRFLDEALETLGLDAVRVLRGRAEEIARESHVRFDVVTARAVAPLSRLARWSLPLCRPGGELLALKGRTAGEELSEAASMLRKLQAGPASVEELRYDPDDDPTFVIRVQSSGSATTP